MFAKGERESIGHQNKKTMSTIVNGRRISLRNQKRTKGASDSSLQPCVLLGPVSTSVSSQATSSRARKKTAPASKKQSKTKNCKNKLTMAENVKVKREADVLVSSAQAKVVEKKTHVFVFHSETELSSPSPFDTIAMRFKENKKPGNNEKHSAAVKIMEPWINYDDEENNDSTSTNGNLLGKSGKRNSSIGVDSNLSFEFAETQEPYIDYNFD